MAKPLLIIIRHSPYSSGLAKAAVDSALASAAFEQPVALLFLGDGVLQLQPEQDGHVLGSKDIGRQLASLPLYDIESVYVDAVAANQYKLDVKAAPLPTKVLSNAGIKSLLLDFDHLLSF